MRLLVATGLVVLLSALGAVASADGEASPAFEAGPRKVRIEVEAWGEECGRPLTPEGPSYAGRTLVEKSGDHLVFTGAVTGRTDACWTRHPRATRVTSRVENGMWRTVCRTPASEPRAEEGTYTFRREGPLTLTFHEETRYAWRVGDVLCAARRIAEQKFVRRPSDEPAQPSSPPTAAPCNPGAPVRLELTPAEKVLEPGTRYCFRARAIDADGCPLPATAITWTVESSPEGRVAVAGGCFESVPSAAESEGRYRVVARSGDLRQSSLVIVRAVDLSDWVARRGSGPEREEDETVRTDRAMAVVVETRTESDGLLGSILGTVIALSLVGAAALLLVRKRRHRSRLASSDEEDIEASVPVAESPPPDEKTTALLTASASSPALDVARRCPACGGEFGSEARFCPRDGRSSSSPSTKSGRASARSVRPATEVTRRRPATARRMRPRSSPTR